MMKQGHHLGSFIGIILNSAYIPLHPNKHTSSNAFDQEVTGSMAQNLYCALSAPWTVPYTLKQDFDFKKEPTTLFQSYLFKQVMLTALKLGLTFVASTTTCKN